MPFLHVTTHLEDKQDDDLLFDYDESSFPSFLVLDHEGKLLARHRGWRTVAGFDETLKKVAQAADLAKKAAAGDKAAAIDWALLRCELNAIDLADLEELLENKTLSDAQKKKFASLAADAEVADMKRVLQKQRFSNEALADAGEMFAEHLAKGGVPLSRWNRGLFWLGIGYHAAAEGKAELFSRALEELAPLEESDAIVRYKLKDLKAHRIEKRSGG